MRWKKRSADQPEQRPAAPEVGPHGIEPGRAVDTVAAYRAVVEQLKRDHGHSEAMELAVGGNFDEGGVNERSLLFQSGLQQDSYLIDVGCGSGRLAKQLTPYPQIKYLGVDVIPDLLEHARAIADRQDFRFQFADGRSIPETDSVADFVVFFSVFTHLLHEHSYVYLREACRVLKPGGKILFTFFDFKVPEHWEWFGKVVDALGSLHSLAMFLSKDAIEVWAQHLDMRIEEIIDGNQASITGHELPSRAGEQPAMSRVSFGQSYAILTKPSGSSSSTA